MALREFSRDPARFDLVITDHAMPHMSGLTLTRRLLDVRPDIPVILCTGYGAAVDERAAKAAGIAEFLMKPLTREELAGAVKKTLAGRRREK
ncbi:MAG: Transcriptional regulatory protein QseF [Syntrophorhabdaceae bacterium PtaU1.Bin034]|nr:MAG: Transcriptional regulatory protein QseF [Syntrophorhabdaceae bacterium PtaU1.Bin034]